MIRSAIFILFIPALAALSAARHTAHAAEGVPECPPVARLFGEVICAGALDQALPVEAIMAETGIEGPADSSEKDAIRAVALRSLVWSKAMERKYGTSSVTPTEAEIEAFRDQYNAITAERYETDKKSAALLRRYIAEYNYKPPHKAKIEHLLQSLDVSILFYEKQKEHQETLPVYFGFISSDAEKKLVTQMLRRWKEDKALFEDFGGRLMQGSGRLIPLDAYRKFYRYMVDEGRFKVEDNRFKDLFADLEQESRHELLHEDDPLYREYFRDPSWRFRMANGGDRLTVLESWLKNLPVAEDGR